MNLDFPLILTVATLTTGVVWVGYFIWCRYALTGATNQEEPLLVEYAKSFFPILLLVLVIRSFVVEPFKIPSGSMLPTLEVGDFILVNKYAYGLRLPVVDHKIVEIGEPQRGDVVVFRYPANPRINYIKRVIGLPGDKVEYKNKVLYINGQAMKQSFLGQRWFPRSERFSERLGSVDHQIYKDLGVPAVDFEVVVPPENYFMMGDNRDNSNDSRVWGMMPEGNIVGKAFAIWLHWDALFSLPKISRNQIIK